MILLEKEGSLFSFLIAKFETCITLKEQNCEESRINALLMPLKLTKNLLRLIVSNLHS